MTLTIIIYDYKQQKHGQNILFITDGFSYCTIFCFAFTVLQQFPFHMKNIANTKELILTMMNAF